MAGLSVTETFNLSISDPTTFVAGVNEGSSHNDFLDYRCLNVGINADAKQGDNIIYGSAFADTLSGGTGNNSDNVYGGVGSDSLTSSSAPDTNTFWYNETNSGNDTITDFADSSNHIGFVGSTSGTTSFGQLTVTNSAGAGTAVKLIWTSGSVVLQSTTHTANVTAADFTFIA